jgi:serine phosphatase RsbU (regulator of sigma subunit)
MLEARQKALHGEAAQVQADLQQLPISESSPQGRTREQAQGHVGQAVEKMTRFEEKLTETRYDSSISTQKIEDISELADSVSRELLEAGKAIRQGLPAGKPQTADAKAQDMAEQLAEDAEAMEEALSPAERQRMLERLEAAKRLLETIAGPQWATVSGGGTPGGGHVYTKDAYMAPAETARMLARQFWSIALEAREEEAQPVADEPSDVEFFQAESEFFEAAAKYTPPGTEK